MMAKPLTARQAEVLEIICESIGERGIAPTLAEIGLRMGGISRVSVLDHLRALERKGAIAREPRLARSITVLDEKFRCEFDLALKLADALLENARLRAENEELRTTLGIREEA